MTRKELLESAMQIVCNDRNNQYGEPEDSFECIAKLWSSYLEDDIGKEDVAIMMMLLKIARLKSIYYESLDSWVDIAGYAACGVESSTKQDKASDGSKQQKIGIQENEK